MLMLIKDNRVISDTLTLIRGNKWMLREIYKQIMLT